MYKDFQKMNIQDLEKTLKQKREALLDTRFSLSGSRTRKSSETKKLKKDIAHITMLLESTESTK